MTLNAQEAVAAEVTALRQLCEQTHEQDVADGKRKVQEAEQTMANAHELELKEEAKALQTEHDAVLRRLADDHALVVERLKLRENDEIKQVGAPRNT